MPYQSLGRIYVIVVRAVSCDFWKLNKPLLTRRFGRHVIDKARPMGGSCLSLHDENYTRCSCTALKLAQALHLSGLRDRDYLCQIIYILCGVGRARVTCTGHVQCKPPYRSLEPQGPQGPGTIKVKTKIINRSTVFINEQLYMHFLTIFGTAELPPTK